MGNTLIVRIPLPEDLNDREVQEYILEGLRLSLLVLGVTDACEVLKPSQLFKAKESHGNGRQAGHIKAAAHSSDATNEKRKIMERLQSYRRTEGLGCWAAVARASGGKLSEPQLRDMATGTAVFPIEEWKRADKALDKVCRRTVHVPMHNYSCSM